MDEVNFIHSLYTFLTKLILLFDVNKSGNIGLCVCFPGREVYIPFSGGVSEGILVYLNYDDCIAGETTLFVSSLFHRQGCFFSRNSITA